MSKYIFVIGGVMSSVGKGIATASIGKILQSRGFKVTAVKIDPYVNIDAGTMNPIEHGEVFVTEDGVECDQDIGNYERFLNVDIFDINYITTGRIYQSVIQKERNLAYGGKCVEVVPHIPEEVIRRIKKVAKNSMADFVMIEIGGTVGEYQNLIFLEAARMMHLRSPEDIFFILISYLPIPKKVGEMKTKPTQYATRTLNSSGIQPDLIIGRSEKPLDELRKKKISIFCNINKKNVISAPDVDFIYEVPINFENEHLAERIMSKFNLKSRKKNLKKWRRLVEKIKETKKEVKIGIVGKYFSSGVFTLTDSYISVIEAIRHSSWYWSRKPKILWIDSEEFEKNPLALKKLRQLNGVIIPGGFGARGIEGKIKVINYVRKNKIPFLGLCYGMQIACIEYARNVCRMPEANTTEINPKTKYPIIDIMPEQKKNLKEKNFGATMRLGAYPSVLKENTFSLSGLWQKKYF